MLNELGVLYIGPLDLSTFRLDAKLRRCVRPQRATNIFLSALVDVAGVMWWTT
jgi:hypothetical protein